MPAALAVLTCFMGSPCNRSSPSGTRGEVHRRARVASATERYARLPGARESCSVCQHNPRKVRSAPLSLPAKQYRSVHVPFRVADDAGNQPVCLQPFQTLLRNLVLEFAVSVVQRNQFRHRDTHASQKGCEGVSWVSALADCRGSSSEGALCACLSNRAFTVNIRKAREMRKPRRPRNYRGAGTSRRVDAVYLTFTRFRMGERIR